MASLLLLLLPLFSVLILATTITESEAFSRAVKAPYPVHKPEKLTHLHFYFHDIISGNKPTAVAVARGPTTNSSATSFGLVGVADDPLTVGPEITSGEVGRAQGVYASADQKNTGLLMVFNLVFTKGEFSGSTLAMYGRNQVLSKVREMPIIGGTGTFRFGRGYAQAKSFSYNMTSGDAVVEYDVYVWH
ncbi:Dirigent protein 21 [Cardamine amara subsp. amara]|uniref:Dirigent protein n=1 Tax=Cardamine amara subsp. amara TaxID=228776 RepID=A0ABD0ZHD1_CARAN